MLRLTHFGAVVAVVAALAAPTRADAAPVTLTLDGEFGPTTELGGVALGALTPFTFQATFDSAADTFPVLGFGIYPITNFTITVGGVPYTGVPGPNFNVLLTSGTVSSVGLTDDLGANGFIAAYLTGAPVFDADNPVPPADLTLPPSMFAGNFAITPYTIPLAGVPGGLVINDLNSGFTPTVASLTDGVIIDPAIPEPATMAVTGFGLLVLGVVKRRRAKAA